MNIQNVIDEFFSSYCVRLRNSGSRYDPFNILFMNMYYKLCVYEPDYHQVHMEELLVKTGYYILNYDVEKIKAGKETLMNSAQALFSKLYEQNGPGANAGTGTGTPDFSDDDVVDADYKEI